MKKLLKIPILCIATLLLLLGIAFNVDADGSQVVYETTIEKPVIIQLVQTTDGLNYLQGRLNQNIYVESATIDVTSLNVTIQFKDNLSTLLVNNGAHIVDVEDFANDFMNAFK